MAEIRRVSIKHDAIMDYLLTNPGAPLSEVAGHFGLTQAWLSTVIHSDAFQAVLKEKREMVFQGTVMPLREKIVGVAHLGVEKLGEALENASAVSDKEFIADTTDSILKNLGFSPKSAPPSLQQNVQNNNFFTVDKETLADARKKMKEAQTVQPEGVLIEQDTTDTSEEV